MAEVYASLIIKDLRTINDVPTQIKEDVKVALIKGGHNDLVQESE